MFIDFIRKNEKTEFTRMCIAEAIVEQLKETDLKQIRISNVVKKAGVSRMTFYNNYHTITEALEDYMMIIVGLYINECNNTKEYIGSFQDYEHILFALKFFDQYRNYFMVLAHNNLHSIMINAVNDFMVNHFSESTPFSPYEMYCYAGGLLNAFLKWEENKESEDIENIASIICKLYNHN